MVEQVGKVSCIRGQPVPWDFSHSTLSTPGYLGLFSKGNLLRASDIITITLNNIGQAVGWQASLGCRHQELQNRHAGLTGLG